MRELTRLIDANANRATEAARTLEDVARFVLDDGPLAAACKRIRHALESSLAEAGQSRSSRIADRDVRLDRGVANSKADLHSRRDLAEIIAAAAGRLAEALRVLEEAIKTSHPPLASRLESCRYEAYDAEANLQRRVNVARPRWPVCVLITESLCAGRAWLDVARAAIEGGASCVQLREKHLPDRELLERAATLVRAARDGGAAAVINDRPDIALLAGADGVHLGQDDLRVPEARRIVGPSAVIGVSCSTPEQAAAAARDGADLVGLGAMYQSGTKPKPSIAGTGLLTEVLADPDLAGLPHLAIGGIDADRARRLAALGCTGVAVSAAVCSAHDPAAATADILTALDHAPELPRHADGVPI